MKIAYISPSIIPSKKANSVQIVKMCAALSRLGHEVALFSPLVEDVSISEDTIFKNYNIKDKYAMKFIPCRAARGKSITYIIGLLKKLKDWKPDLIMGRFLAGCYLSSLHGYRTVYEAHSTAHEIGKIEDLIFRLAVRRGKAFRIVAISRELAQRMAVFYQIRKKDILVLHDGCDISRSSTSVQNTTSNITIGYVGSFEEGKGVQVVLEIAKRMRSLKFIIVGGTKEQIKTAKEMSTPNVEFLGYIEQNSLDDVYKKLDIALLPNQKKMYCYNSKIDISEYNSPLKLFEYMAHGKPIVASDIPVLHEVLTSDAAIFVTPENINEWCKAVEKLKDPILRCSMGEKALKILEKNYTWDIRAKQLIEFAA